MFNLICLGLFLVYLIGILLTYYGLKSLPQKREIHNNKLKVSIIIAAKDEAENLPACLESLSHLDYPEKNLEIILVNDRSNDNTGELMKSFKRKSQYIEITTPSVKWTGKSNALIQGIKQSSGEILFFTDADCIVPSSWIKEMLNYFKQGYNLVSGTLILNHEQWKNPCFASIQTLDWLYFTLMGSAWTHLGCPVSIWGNNFAICKSTYIKSGGFEKAGSHILEDFALLKQVAKLEPHRIILPIEKSTTVFTKPELSWKSFYHQRKRWAIGARSHSRLIKILSGIIGLFYSAILLSFFYQSISIFITGIIILIASDLLILLYGCKKLNKLSVLKYYPLYKGFSLIYTMIFIPIFFLGKSVQWKDSKYKTCTQ